VPVFFTSAITELGLVARLRPGTVQTVQTARKTGVDSDPDDPYWPLSSPPPSKTSKTSNGSGVGSFRSWVRLPGLPSKAGDTKSATVYPNTLVSVPAPDRRPISGGPTL
jgi:hypothetical protein